MFAAVLALGGGAQAAVPCSNLTCTSDPCVINTAFDFDASCTRDFSGFDVIINKPLTVPNLQTLDIKAKSLKVDGTSGNAGRLIAQGGTIVITTVSGDFEVLGGVGLPRLDVSGAPASVRKISVNAAGAAKIHGRMSANATGVGNEGGEVWIKATSFDVNTDTTTLPTISADASSGKGGRITLIATGPIIMTDSDSGDDLTAKGAGTAKDGGDITVIGGSVTTQSEWVATSGSGKGGRIGIQAANGPLVIESGATVNAGGGSGATGGDIDLLGNGDMTIEGKLLASASGASFNGGTIETVSRVASAAQKVTVAAGAELNVVGGGGGADGTIHIGLMDNATHVPLPDLDAAEHGPPCEVELAGTLKARATLSGGRIDLFYREKVDATLAMLEADDVAAGGGVFIHCPCGAVDPATSTCTTCHLSAVANLPPAGTWPVEPQTKMSLSRIECTGCGNGLKDGAETCDDGNLIETDWCLSGCTGPSCGDTFKSSGEECEDGAALNGTAASCCNADCTLKGVGSDCDDGVICTGSDKCQTDHTCKGTEGACELILLPDTSGSMSWDINGDPTAVVDDQRLTKVKQATQYFLDLLQMHFENKAKVGVATFPDASCDAKEVKSPELLNPAWRGIINSEIGLPNAPGGLQGHGRTPLLAGLSTAAGMFSTEPDTAKVILLLSDGYHNCPELIADTDPDDVDSVLNNLSTEKIRTYTTGFGQTNDYDSAFLQEIADINSAEFTPTGALADVANWVPATVLSTAYTKILVGAFGLDFTVDPPGTLSSGTKMTQTVPIIADDEQVLFLLSWATAKANRLTMTVKSSDGAAVSASASGVKHVASDTHMIMAVDETFLQQPGKVGSAPWQIEISSETLASGESESFQYSVITDSALKMRVDVQPRSARVGDVLTLTARLLQAGKPVAGLSNVVVGINGPRDGVGNWLFDNEVSAADLTREQAKVGAEQLSPVTLRSRVLTKARGIAIPGRTSPISLHLFDDGTHGDRLADDGIYTNQFASADDEGAYIFDFSATGDTAAGQHFQRQQTLNRELPLRIDSAHSLINTVPLGNGRFTVSVTPQDKFGNHLGPGRASAIVVTASTGRLLGSLTDLGNGSYSQVLELPENTDPRTADIAVSSVVRAAPGKPGDGRPKGCFLTNFFKRLFCRDE